MRITFSSILVFFILALVACQKAEVPPGENGEPLFLVTGEMNGDDLSIAAGVDNVELIPTHDFLRHGIYRSIACFRSQVDATSLTISINSQQRSWPGAGLDLSESLAVSDREYQSEIAFDPLIFEFHCPEQDASSYNWTVNGVELGEDSHEIQYEVEPNTNIDVTLVLESGELCQDSIDVEIPESLVDASNGSFALFTTAIDENDELECWYDGDYREVESVLWSVTDQFGNVDLGQGLRMTKELATPGFYTVNMQAELLDGSAYKHVQHVVFDEDRCLANCFYRNAVPDESLIGAGQVLIEYVDETGHIYSSQFVENSQNTFQILEHTGEIENAFQYRSQKLRVAFDCDLLNTQDQSDTLKLRNMTGIIAVSYPQ